MKHVVRHTHRFVDHAARVLNDNGRRLDLSVDRHRRDDSISSVLLLIGRANGVHGCRRGPCLILNKRSRFVRQAGDLCFPGGGIAPRRDSLLARLLRLPGMPLARWPYWAHWRRNDRSRAELVALFFAIGLRESFEEMRLNPLGVDLVGPLPPQRLRMFQRTIYPVAAWVPRQKHYFPNWEVEKIVPLPIEHLLRPGGYLRCRLIYPGQVQAKLNHRAEDLPCFRFDDGEGGQLLWGATYHIVITFLELVLGFRPPPLGSRPLVMKPMAPDYLSGPRCAAQK